MTPDHTRALSLRKRFRNSLRHLTTRHRQGNEGHVFILSTPRSGSTWLAELIATQGRYKLVNEPFNLRRPVVRDVLGLDDWGLLLDPAGKPAMRAYLQKFIDDEDDDPRFKRELPFSRFWHFTTDRMLFKILFAGEDDIDWFRREFGGQIVLLLRHPIPVSLSRQEFPRLQSLLARPYAENFTPQQRELARQVIESGNILEIGVLDWVLQNSVPLRAAGSACLVVSYEQMVVDLPTVVQHLARHLSLPRPEVMLTHMNRPSASAVKSSHESRRLLQRETTHSAPAEQLIARWRKRVSPEQEARAFDLLDAFGIDYYLRGSLLPSPRWLLRNGGR